MFRPADRVRRRPTGGRARPRPRRPRARCCAGPATIHRVGAADRRGAAGRRRRRPTRRSSRSYPRELRRRRRLPRHAARPAERPREPDQGARKTDIQHVGISNFRLPIRFRTRDGGEVQLETSVTGSVSLEADRKGINMSRIMRSFYKHAETPFSFEVIGAVLDSYLADLDSYDARIMMRFRYPMLKRSLRSGLEGYQYYDVALEMAKTAAGDPAHRPPRLRLFLDLPVLARALRACPPHPQPDRDAALAALGGAGVGRARRRATRSGSRTSSTSATPRSRPRPR